MHSGVFSFAWLDREKDEDEGIPSETEDDKRQLETKAKEMRGERNTLRVCVNTIGSNATKCFPHHLSLLVRSVEAEGLGDHVSAGGEGATLQRDVGGLESRRGGLPAGRTFLQVRLQPGAAPGGVCHEGCPAGR